MLQYNKRFLKGGTELDLLKIGMMGLAIGGLLAGCGTSETSKSKEEVKVNAATSSEVDPKEWKDLSAAGDLEDTDFEPNAKVWIADTLEVFSQEPDESLYEDGFDEGYDYYMKVMTVSHILGSYIRVEGGDLEKDFENLWILTRTIEHEQYARAAHIDIDKYENDKLSAVKESKAN